MTAVRESPMQYRMVISCVMAVLASSVAIVFLYRHAEALGLVDRPSERKQHVGNIPLIGGLAVFFGVVVSACFEGQSPLFTNVLLLTSAVLALVGALDDRFDLSVRTRLLVQTGAVLTMVYCTGVYIHTLGHMFGNEFELGALGVPMTLIAVIGLLNAFNMMDGIDGLAGMLALVSIGAINVFQGFSQWHSVTLLLLLAAALLPDLAANLGFVGRKIFLGDAGSIILGYFLAWTLIQLSQQTHPHLSTVDVLWCVALPVLDTLAVMVRRMRAGKSPFKPDRGHIHHIMMDAGLGPRTTLVALVGLAMTLVFLGTLARQLAPGSNLLSFGALAVIYIAIVGRIRRGQLERKARATTTATAASRVTPFVHSQPMTTEWDVERQGERRSRKRA
jgi:UDP-GlcNAc:undecaprenyl-phosphate/decaprenyl-phosphate GlcNAc-1-phosphate transferase